MWWSCVPHINYNIFIIISQYYIASVSSGDRTSYHLPGNCLYSSVTLKCNTFIDFCPNPMFHNEILQLDCDFFYYYYYFLNGDKCLRDVVIVLSRKNANRNSLDYVRFAIGHLLIIL